MPNSKRKPSRKKLRTIPCSLIAWLFCLSVFSIAGSHPPCVSTALLDDLPLETGWVPFTLARTLSAAAAYERPYGLSDLSWISAGVSVPFSRTALTLTGSRISVSDVYREAAWSPGISRQIWKRVHGLLLLRRETRHFAGDPRTDSRHAVRTSLGWEGRRIAPFAGVEGQWEDRILQVHAGSWIIPDNRSRFAFLVKQDKQKHIQFIMAHNLLLSPSFQVRWGIQTFPVRLELGAGIQPLQTLRFFLVYRSHSELGAGLQGTLVFGWPD